MRARKAGGNGAQRGGAVKNGHAKPRAGTKPAKSARSTRASQPGEPARKETVAAAVKKTVPAATTGNGLGPAHRPEAATSTLTASAQPRGNPPPLPAPIASFNF
jgi:hypothetical protein